MKILTRKKQEEIIRMLSENQVIAVYSKLEEDKAKILLRNDFEIAGLVGGIYGIDKIHNAVVNFEFTSVSDLAGEQNG